MWPLRFFNVFFMRTGEYRLANCSIALIPSLASAGAALFISSDTSGRLLHLCTIGLKCDMGYYCVLGRCRGLQKNRVPHTLSNVLRKRKGLDYAQHTHY